MKRIALVITELHPGGAEKCCVQLAIYFKQLGYEVLVLQLWPAPPAEKTQLVDQLSLHNIPWKSGGAVKAWDLPKLIWWLRGELKTFQPDVVQSFLFHANVASALALRGLHGRFFGGARVRQPERWRQRLQRWAARNMEKLICVSQSVEEHCRMVEQIPANRLTTIPNGIVVDTNQASTSDSQTTHHPDIPPNARLLLFVGRLVAQKGVETLVEHSDLLLTELPDHHLICVGDGTSRPRLEQLKSNSRCGDRLHFIGWQPNPLDWMRSSEMLLLPAVYEGMPNVVLEAMSVAKPVVAFDVDGLEELLGDDEPGRKQRIAPGDMRAFVKAAQELAGKPGMAQQLGERNRQRARHGFRLDEQFAKYLTLYHEPLNKP